MNYMLRPGLKKLELQNLSRSKRDAMYYKEFEKVCNHFEKDPKEIKGLDKVQKRELVEIRQITMCLIKKRLKVSLAETGGFFGKDHATVLHAIKTVKNLRETDKYYKDKTECLLGDLNL